MKHFTFITSEGTTFTRVDKRTAREAYNNDLYVMVCPYNYATHPNFHLYIKRSDGNFENAISKSYYRSQKEDLCNVFPIGRMTYYLPIVESNGIEEYDYSFC